LARRNNKKRVTAPSAESVAPPPMRADVTFTTPTDFVELPSGGIFYP